MTIILIIAGIIIAVPLILALFVKRKFTIEREVTINKPKHHVFTYIKYLKNQDNYSKWMMIDPNMKKMYKGTDGTVGFVYGWRSDNKNVGTGEQEITKIKEGERIDFEIRFTRPFKSTDPAYMTSETVTENQTKVKLGYIGKMKYPTNLMILLIEKKIGKDMETGLTNLKMVFEKQ